MHYLDGSSSNGDTSLYLQRILTAPLMLLSSMALGSFLGDYATGMFALNLIFYLLSVLVMYRIATLIYSNLRVAFITTILFFTSWGLFSFGPTYLADMGGWFFFLLSTMYALSYYRKPEQIKWFYLSVIASIIGVLFKEYGALGMLSLTLLIGISSLNRNEKIKRVIVATIFFSGSLLLYYLWFYLHFNYSYLDWYTYNYKAFGASDATSTNMYTLTTFIKVVVLIFLPGWPLFLTGLTREVKFFFAVGKERACVLGALLPASAAFIIWPAFTHRVAFILVPWAALIAAYGIARIRSNVVVALILVSYALVNYHVNFLMTTIDLPF